MFWPVVTVLSILTGQVYVFTSDSGNDTFPTYEKCTERGNEMKDQIEKSQNFPYSAVVVECVSRDPNQPETEA